MKAFVIGAGDLARRVKASLAEGGHEPARLEEAEIVLLAMEVGCDPETGEADPEPLRVAAAAAAPQMASGSALVLVSAAPVGTTRGLHVLLRALRPKARIEAAFDSSFLRKSPALGAESAQTQALLIRLHAARAAKGEPLLHMGLEAAEIAAQACGAFALLRAAWMKEFAGFCAASGAETALVLEAVNLTDRADEPSAAQAGALTLAARSAGAPLTLLEAALLAEDARRFGFTPPEDAGLETLWREDAAEEASKARGKRRAPPPPRPARAVGRAL